MRFFHQKGLGLAYALVTVAVLGMLSVAGYNLFVALKNSNGTQIQTQSGELLTQAAYTLATEASDSDADGYTEPTAGSVVNGDGWNIPATSGAPKSDAWGTAFKYCPWDNGSTNSSTGRLTGDTPGTQASVVYAVISAGPDKVFNTTCAQAKAGTLQGDDGYRVKTQSQVSQGVGGTVYYGDPVATLASLATLNPVRVGETRLVKSTNLLYTNPTGTVGASYWLLPQNPLVVSGADCSTFPLGTYGHDSTGDSYICK